MNHNYYIYLKERKWAIAIIAFILFINPVFFFWAHDFSFKEKIVAWITCIFVAAALLGLSLFFKQKKEKLYFAFLFLASAVPNMIVWGYLWLSRSYLKRDMFWVIFNSYSSEAKEYVASFIPWQIVAVALLYLAIGAFFVTKLRAQHALSVKKHKKIVGAATFILLSCIILHYLSQAVPIIEFYKSYYSFLREKQIFEKEKAVRKYVDVNVQCNLSDSTKHVFVILLGESTTTCHMQLYGYFRQTTPRMVERIDQLDVYTDVVTSDTHTYGVMQKALTFANHQHPEYYKKKPSIVEIFNAAGFTTYWIANNPILDKWGASYGIIAQQAHHVYDVSFVRKPDEIVLPTLQIALDDTITQNKIIFVHLMGNHHTYRSRFPKEFAEFNHKQGDSLPSLGFRNYDMYRTIDDYDNSILYGDFVFESVIQELEAVKNQTACLLYFADHGEEVYDVRPHSGHHLSNVFPCQCQIPFILWRSENYKKMYDVTIDTARPYAIEDVIHSISTLCKLDYDDYDPTLSIFSSTFVPPTKRIVGKEDYNDILKKISQLK